MNLVRFDMPKADAPRRHPQPRTFIEFVPDRPIVMFMAMNRFKVREGEAAAFETRWRTSFFEFCLSLAERSLCLPGEASV